MRLGRAPVGREENPGDGTRLCPPLGKAGLARTPVMGDTAPDVPRSPPPAKRRDRVLIRYSDWKKPTDDAYAFPLRSPSGREGFQPEVPALGRPIDLRDIAREVLQEADAARFEQRIARWSGPEDVIGAERPYQGVQRSFVERAWQDKLEMECIEGAMRGVVQVLRSPAGQVDYVLRDHHMLDVALYHFRTTGQLPRGLFHADRHSDWCKDSYLEARTPQQAATWWRLFEGLKRPESALPVLREEDVFFATAKAERTSKLSGRDVGFNTRVPYFLDPDDLAWTSALERPGAVDADWVSCDLDYFQPAPQLAVSKGLLRDPRFHRMMTSARVRVFCLSPQFTNGGDRIDPWETQGSLPSSLRLLNLLRRLGTGARLRR